MSKPTSPRLPFDEPAPAAAASTPLLDAADRAAAVDPRLNIVLEASAGTGKTRVLVDRYINLIRAGVEPRNILAITFTRKAAAEMRERILSNLRRSAEEGGIDPARWRSLRDRLGEVSISTIDAFCLALLREFPLEADLDPGFGMADETEMLRLVDEALDRAMQVARGVARDDSTVALVFAELGDWQLRQGLAALIDRRLVADPILRRAVRPTPRELTPERLAVNTIDRLRATLEGVEGGLGPFVATGPVRHARYQLLQDDLRSLTGGVAPDQPERQVRLLVDGLQEYFFTRSGTPRKRWSPPFQKDDYATPAVAKEHQRLATTLADRIGADLAAFRRDLNAVLTRGVWRLFTIAVAEYRRTLDEHAVVDFPEALQRTLDLMGQMGEFARSRLFLESRYHHLLVDEFQDTSEAQWQLVWRLVQSWREGTGLQQDLPLTPTIFVVGDRKQSIYGFRDADAGVLARAAASIRELRPEGEVRRAIRQSFRAVPALLAFTNDLCAAIEIAPDRPDGFTFEDKDQFPVTSGPVAGGPALGVVPAANLEDQAARVAEEIAQLLVTGSVRDRHTGVTRGVLPGDIAILFRTREGHQAFETALADRGIPNYVYKGLGFFDADEIKDVFAVLRFLANPASELTAAALLRSRLVRLSDEALSELAPDLARAVVEPVPADERLRPEDRRALDALRASAPGWIALADRLPPAEVLDRVLTESAYSYELAGPRASQARENLKKIRGLIRRLQNRGYATIGRIAAHLDRLSAGDESNAAIDAVNAVNLMTVHAAKGLEFPVVFLANLGRGAGGGRMAIRVAALAADDAAVSVGEFSSAADDDAAARDREELKRLLYVAVTRARDRLYLAAALDRGELPVQKGGLVDVLPATLRQLIALASRLSEPSIDWHGASSTHRFRIVGASAAGRGAAVEARGEPLPAARTADFAPLVAGVPGRRRISTDVEGRTYFRATPGGPRLDRRRLGTLVHRLLERTVPIGEADDSEMMNAALRLAGPEQRGTSGAPDALARAAVDCVRAFRSLPEVASWLTAPRRWHEVPIVLREDDALWSGAIDLVIEAADGDLMVLEFKTGRPVAAHERQLARYVAAVQRLRPGVQVRGRVIYGQLATDVEL